MLYGRRLDQALEHVDGSRYALVHAVSKRARQITLWLTADPAELRAESAPPPAAGELITRDPVALAEAEILAGEVIVHWDPEGKADLIEPITADEVDPLDETLLLESLSDEDDDGELAAEEDGELTPALAQVLDGEAPAEVVEDDDAEEEAEATVALEGDEITAVSLEGLAEQEAAEDEEDES
jgi:RNA polymerase Rpb6